MSLATLRPFILRLRRADAALKELERLTNLAQIEWNAARQELDDAIAIETANVPDVQGAP